jgi:hypothetical protein
LTGNLDPLFCDGTNIDDAFSGLSYLEADCLGSDPEVVCSCCPECAAISGPTLGPTSGPLDRLNELLEILLVEADLLDRTPLSSPGTFQYQALMWLANDDPANLDFEGVSPAELLERFIMVLLYFSTGGDKWSNSIKFLSNSSACEWEGVSCYSMKMFEINFYSKNLSGQLPTELGLLTNLQDLKVCKFTTIFSSEVDPILSLGSLSNTLFLLWFCSQ